MKIYALSLFLSALNAFSCSTQKSTPSNTQAQEPYLKSASSFYTSIAIFSQTRTFPTEIKSTEHGQEQLVELLARRFRGTRIKGVATHKMSHPLDIYAYAAELNAPILLALTSPGKSNEGFTVATLWRVADLSPLAETAIDRNISFASFADSISSWLATHQEALKTNNFLDLAEFAGNLRQKQGCDSLAMIVRAEAGDLSQKQLNILRDEWSLCRNVSKARGRSFSSTVQFYAKGLALEHKEAWLQHLPQSTLLDYLNNQLNESGQLKVICNIRCETGHVLFIVNLRDRNNAYRVGDSGLATFSADIAQHLLSYHEYVKSRVPSRALPPKPVFLEISAFGRQSWFFEVSGTADKPRLKSISGNDLPKE